jgi:hypothetical protein
MLIKDIFRWKRSVEIKDGDKVLAKLYLKLVGDIDYSDARNFSLKRSKQLRLKLRNKESDEYNINFMDVDNLTKDELIESIVSSELVDYRDEAISKLSFKEVPELPENPTLEQQEDYESKVEEASKNRVEEISNFMTKRSEERKVELGKVEDIGKLKEQYISSVVNMKCSEVFQKTFRNYCVYKGTYLDSKYSTLAFSSFEEFESSSTLLLNQIISAYNNLEINGEELKN